MARLAFPPVFTVAVKVIDQVATGASVVAGVLAAVVNVGLAVGPLPAAAANARVGVHAIDAGAAVSTGLLSQSLMFSWQYVPVKPLLQSQVNLPPD